MKDGRSEDIIRQKIKTLEANDISSIDTDEMWGRLNISLNKKPARRIHLIYYWAAAVLLIIFVIALLPKENTEIQVAKSASKEQAPSVVNSKNEANDNNHVQYNPEVSMEKHPKEKKITVQKQQDPITAQPDMEIPVKKE
ncbi:MAG: hypothetical protein ACHQF0_17975, partial [Chitinophagales bacterium]